MLTLIAQTPLAASSDVTTLDYAMLGVYLVLAIGVSFLCSMLEACLLSVPASHVALMEREQRRGGALLKSMKASLDRPLAAILTLNTIAHTIGAAGVGAQVLVIWGSGAVAVGSAVVTLLILVFSEIIPKSIGAAKAKALAPFTAYAIQAMVVPLWPLLIVLQWISSRIGGGHAVQVTRDEVAITAELGQSAGVIDPKETRVIRNLFRLNQVTVEDIMTPRPVAFMLPHDTTPNQAVEEHGRIRFTRIPVHGPGGVDDIIGHVTRYALHHARDEGQGDRPLSELVKPLGDAQESDTVADTLDRFIREQQHMLRVEDEFGGTAGLVTLEDCVETLLGVEIVDETDSAHDMRIAAKKLLDRRREERQ